MASNAGATRPRHWTARLRFRTKMILLPAWAALGAIGVLIAALLLNGAVQRETALIGTGYVPSGFASREMEVTLTQLQRALQDAVQAAEPEELLRADSIARSLRAQLEQARSNPITDNAEIDALSRRFDAYYALARTTSGNMMRDAQGVDFTGIADDIARMTTELRELSAVLAERTRRDREAAETALAGMRRLNATSTRVIVGLLLLVVAGLVLVSTWIIRDVLSALKEMTAAASRISSGRIGEPIGKYGDDEIGMLAESFRGMMTYIGGVAAAVDSLAQGDMSVDLEPRSADDLLSRNVLRAKATLSALVSETAALIEAAREGDLGRRGRADAYSGVYAELVSGTNRMLDMIGEPTSEAAAALARVAARDLSVRIDSSFRGDYAQMKDSFNNAMTNLEGALVQVVVGSQQVASASSQISTSSHELAHASGEHAEALRRVFGELEEISEKTHQNAARAASARELTQEAHESAAEGVASMERLSGAIQQMKTSSDATARIVKTIDDIAFQTNLLALNAAVEAARAGDAGRGFAVVAEEVRSLAMRSAEAARNTAALIDDAVRSADHGVVINAEVLNKLGEINARIHRVGDVIAEIAVASGDQSRAVAGIHTSVDHANRVTEQVASAADQSASAAEELNNQAERMQSLVSAFRLRPEARGQVWDQQQSQHLPVARHPRTGFRGRNGDGKLDHRRAVAAFGTGPDDAILDEF